MKNAWLIVPLSIILIFSYLLIHQPTEANYPSVDGYPYATFAAG